MHGGKLTGRVPLVNEEAKVGLFWIEGKTVWLLQLLQRDGLRLYCIKLAVIFLESPDLEQKTPIDLSYFLLPHIKPLDCLP